MNARSTPRDRTVPESPVIPHSAYWSPSQSALSPPLPHPTPSPVSSRATVVSGRSATPVTPLTASEHPQHLSQLYLCQDYSAPYLEHYENVPAQTRFSQIDGIQEATSPAPQSGLEVPSIVAPNTSPGPLTLAVPSATHSNEAQNSTGLTPTSRITGRWPSAWVRLIGRSPESGRPSEFPLSPSIVVTPAPDARPSRFSMFHPRSFASRRETVCPSDTSSSSQIGSSAATPRAPSILGQIEEKGGWGLEVPVVDAPEVIHHDTGKEVAYPMAPPRYESHLFLERPKIVKPWHKRKKYIALMIVLAGLLIGGIVTAILLTQLNKNSSSSSSSPGSSNPDESPDSDSDPSVGVTEPLTSILRTSQLAAVNWTSPEDNQPRYAVVYQDNSSSIFLSHRKGYNNGKWAAVNVTERAMASIKNWGPVRAQAGTSFTLAADPTPGTFHLKLYYITEAGTLYDLSTTDESFQEWTTGDVGALTIAVSPSSRLSNVWQWAFWNETLPTPYHAVYMQTPNDANIHAIYPVNGEWDLREKACDGGINGVGFATCPFVDNRHMERLTVEAGFTNQRLYYNFRGGLTEMSPLDDANTWQPTGATLDPQISLAESSQMQCIQYALSSLVVPVMLSSTWLRLHMWTFSTGSWTSRDVSLNGPSARVYHAIAVNQDMRAFVLDSNLRISEYSIPRGSFWDWQFQTFVEAPS